MAYMNETRRGLFRNDGSGNKGAGLKKVGSGVGRFVGRAVYDSIDGLRYLHGNRRNR